MLAKNSRLEPNTFTSEEPPSHIALEEIQHKGIHESGEDKKESSSRLSEIDKAPLLFKKFPHRFAFLIGVDSYLNFPKLTTALNDISIIGNALSEAPHHYQVTLGKNLSLAELMRLLNEEMPRIVKAENSQVLIYFAGHGIAVDKEVEVAGGRKIFVPAGKLVPKDACGDLSNCLDMQDLFDALAKLPCRHLLLVLDCCFSGVMRWASFETRGLRVPKQIFKERYEFYTSRSAWQALTSTAHDQEALSSIQSLQRLGARGKMPEADMSPFAWYFLQAIQGKMGALLPKDRVITVSRIFEFVREQVEPTVHLSTEDRYRQTPELFPLEKHAGGEYIFNSNILANLASFDAGKNPYKGLTSYEDTVEDTALFYGRERVVRELQERIGKERFLAIIGGSGTGKSSVLKAGVLPKLREAGYEIVAFRPQNKPLEELHKALHSELKLKENPCCIYIDQLEEVFTKCSDKAEQDAFLKRLTELLQSDDMPHFRLVVSLRSDFEPAFRDYAFKDYWQAARYVIPPLSATEVREIVEQPAYQYLLEFDPPELVDIIVKDVSQASGALPLLSFAMGQLYEMGRYERKLTAVNYNAIGGVVGALRKKSQDLYDELEAPEQAAMRKILLRMVSPGRDFAKRRVLKSDLEFTTQEENTRIQKVLDLLIDNRLVVSQSEESGTYFEPTHDAFLKTIWDRYNQWVTEIGKDKLVMLEKLDESVKEYQAKKDKEYLWHGDPRLELIKGEKSRLMNKAEVEFTDLSLRLKRQKINQRNGAILIAFLILSAAATVAWVQRKTAIEKQEEANVQRDSAVANKQAALLYAEKLDLQVDSTAKANLALTKSNKNAVALILFEADQRILALEYVKALERVNVAAQLGVSHDAVSRAYMEIAFWYCESYDWKTCDRILERIAEVSGRSDLVDLLNKVKIAPIRSKRLLAHAFLKAQDQRQFWKLHDKYYPKMRLIEGGEFIMGCDTHKIGIACDEQGSTEHLVRVNDFRMAETETTLRQYQLYLKANGLPVHPMKNLIGEHPCQEISWCEAVAYCNWLSEQLQVSSVYPPLEQTPDCFKQLTSFDLERNGYRLPTEAEWEFAARGKHFPPASEAFHAGGIPLKDFAWFKDNSKTIQPVKTKKANTYGLYDMSGNVAEWCWDFNGDYVISNILNPKGVQIGKEKIMRGGSIQSIANDCAVFCRKSRPFGTGTSVIGFRVVSSGLTKTKGK